MELVILIPLVLFGGLVVFFIKTPPGYLNKVLAILLVTGVFTIGWFTLILLGLGFYMDPMIMYPIVFLLVTAPSYFIVRQSWNSKIAIIVITLLWLSIFFVTAFRMWIFIAR